MKTMRLGWLAAMAMLATVLGNVQAAEGTLKVGDPAPKLDASAWVQGEAVKQFERDKVYVVEFWATWCPPCRTSIPHLNELHNKFKDQGVVVIGQNVWENRAADVAPFVKKMGDKMTYRVALDNLAGGKPNDGRMAKTWMAAAGQNGIPAAFVVDKQGKIAWIGHPMNLSEKILDQVIAGTYAPGKS